MPVSKRRPVVESSDEDEDDVVMVDASAVEDALKARPGNVAATTPTTPTKKLVDIRPTPTKQTSLAGFFGSTRTPKPVEAKKTPGGKTKRETYKCKPIPSSNIKILDTRTGGVLEGLPPISDLQDIFEDMVYRVPTAEQLFLPSRQRKLRVATMCSGTESPLLALGMIGRAMKKMGWGELEIDHAFSCEIEPFKQAYIERNFKPPILFRDIKELGQDSAMTAYGAEVPVPGDVDLLVAGTSCVDYSNLNNQKKDIDDGGESGDTFHGMLRWVKKHRPLIVIQENVVGANWEETRKRYMDIGYSAEYSKNIDSKMYYIPHTRQRGYLMAINTKNSQIPNNWLSAMKKLERKATASLEAFILPDDDRRVAQSRAELSSDTNERRGRTNDWEQCQVRHTNERIKEMIGEKRTLTQWEDGGTCHMQDYMWQDWAAKQTPRVWDLIEINNLKAAKDGYDAMYKAFLWELSQNVDRGTMGKPDGISQCLTPNMIAFLCSRGGPIIGLEALAMQGLPINELLLTRESSGQLQDLAGNAMTSTVVGTAILVSLVLCRDILPDRSTESMSMDVDSKSESISARIVGDDMLQEQKLELSHTTPTYVKSLIHDAQRSSRMCICEGTTAITTEELQACQACNHRSCVKCGGRPEHVYKPLSGADRLSPFVFEETLKKVLPMRLRVSKLDLETLEKAREENSLAAAHITDKDWALWTELLLAAVTGEYRFKGLLRHETWTAVFDAPHGRLELIFNRANRPEWRLFAKCPKTEGENSRKRRLVKRPMARMFVSVGRKSSESPASVTSGAWELCLPTVFRFSVTITGVRAEDDKHYIKPEITSENVDPLDTTDPNLVPSWEYNLGLSEPRFVGMKVWQRLHMSIPDEAKAMLDCDIAGDYKLSDKCGTARNALHRKLDSEGMPLFFFMDQARIRKDNDHFVFSFDHRRLRYGEERQLVAKLSKDWRQSSSATTKPDCTVEGKWCPAKGVKLSPATDDQEGVVLSPRAALKVEVSSCEKAQALLVCRVPLRGQAEHVWAEEWTEVDKIHERTTFEALAWLTERIRSMGQLGEWHNLKLPNDWVRCERCDPTPPKVRWVHQGKKYVPYENQQEAAPYERSLKNRPLPFITHLRLEAGGIGALRIGLNAPTLIHRALSRLPPSQSPAEKPTISWRLVTDYVPEIGTVTANFSILSNKKDPSHEQPPNFLLKLRPEQCRSMGWMIRQEADDAPPFVEEEVAEALLPQMAWRAEGRVQRRVSFRGGVLADQVGYGKTVMSLALIDWQQDEVFVPAQLPGFVPVKATMVVVPHHLVSQWASEITKFLGITYTVISIRDPKDLQRRTARDIMHADIVLVSENVWVNDDSHPYWTNLAGFSGSEQTPPAKGDRRFMDWHGSALANLREQVDFLRENGTEQAFTRLEGLHEQRQQLAEAEADGIFIQGKRKKGAQYAEAKQKNATSEKAGDKRKSPDAENEEEAESSIRAKKVRKGKVVEGNHLSDHWGLRSKKVQEDWALLTAPPLEMFRFNRLVLDEFTYVQGALRAGVMGVAARSRWILSGTPPKEGFAQIKSIADILGVHLGVNDDGEGKAGEQRRKELKNERSRVEQFAAFREVRSPHWHKHRLEVAQRFLDQFVRQNVAEIDEIPWEDHIIPVELPAAERAIYLELSHHLQGLEMKMQRARANANNDRDRRLQESLGNSKSAEEALLKRCSHFTDLVADEDDEPAVRSTSDDVTAWRACELIVADRARQLSDCREDIRRCVNDLVKLEQEINEKQGFKAATQNVFRIWVRAIREQKLDDPDAQVDVIAILDSLLAPAGTDVATIYSDGTVADPEITPEPQRRVSKPKKGKGKEKKEKEKEDEDEDEAVPEFPWPEHVTQKLEMLKKRVQDVRAMARKELCARHRSLRYFRVIRDLQQQQFNSSVSSCPSCGRTGLAAAELAVLSTCGHVGCLTCFQRSTKRDECIERARGCKVVAWARNLVSGSSLGTEDADARAAAQGRRFGAKIEKLLLLLARRIPKDEKVLLFVQFPDLMAKVGDALRIAGVPFEEIRGRNSDKKLEEFQAADSRKRILLMNLAGATASGANLTNANHAIFLSPFLADSEYVYASSETQAVGRVRRYGQTRRVHIWRFLTRDTIDFDEFEKRTGSGYEQLKERFVDV